MTLGRALIIRAVFIGALVSSALACKKGGDDPSPGPDDGDGPSGSWATGDDGSMYNIKPDGSLGPGYDLEADTDLLAIACRGLDTAFVVGEQGLMLRTFDGGDSWEAIELSTTRTLRDVAAARPDIVYVAGDQMLVRSIDSGDSWTEVAVPAASWLQVVTDHLGATGLALADDGSLWRWADGQPPQLAITMAGAHGLAMAHGGAHAAIAGAGGLLARSVDGGASWAPIATGTEVDLHAAWVTDAGDVVAVGDGGTVVRAAGDAVTISTPGAGTLRAVHINARGEGLAAGDAGQVLNTVDGGRTWRPLPVALPTTIRGLDEVNGDGHL